MPDADKGALTFRVLRRGDRGDAVAEVRRRLIGLGLAAQAAGRPEVFDDQLATAVRDFQQRRGLSVDGVVGPSTYRALDEARWRLGDRVLTHVAGSLMSGDDVVALQQRLLELGFPVGRVDGRFGARTETSVREFQRNVGLQPDGTCGPATFKAFGRLSPRVSGGQPNALRAEERIRRAGPRLSGKVVVLDPAVGRISDPALRRRADAITLDVASRVEGRLVVTGVEAYLTNRGGADEASEAERAELANRTGAHLCVSFQVDVSANPDAAGVSTYFYGSDAHGVRSSAGERFASLAQREIVARTDLADLRSHAKTWDLLRRTRMPTVRIDLGYLSNAGDLARLNDPAFRDVIAEAVVVAVQRVYLSPETDAKTGFLRVSDLQQALLPRHA